MNNSRNRVKNKNNLKLLASIVVSLALLAYFLHKLDFAQFQHTIAGASPFWLLVGVALFYLQMVFRGIRLKCVLPHGRVSFPQAVGVQGIYAFLNSTLPAGLSDISLVAVLKKGFGISYAEGSSGFLVLRVVEMVMCLLAFMCLLLFPDRVVPIENHIVDGCKIGAAFMGGLLLLCSFLFLYPKAFNRIAACFPFRTTRLGIKLKDFLARMRSHVVRTISVRYWLLLVAASLLTYGAAYLGFVAACNAVGAGLNHFQVLFIFVMLYPLNIIPIRGVFNAGTFEFSWVLLLGLLGIDQGRGTIIAFSVHIVLLLNAIATFLPSFLFLHKKARRWFEADNAIS